MESKKKEDEPFPATSRDWNSNIEKTIKETGESCKGYKWMHITAAKKAAKIHMLLTWSIVIIGPLGGLFGALYTTITDSVVLQIIVIVCGFVSGVVGYSVKEGVFQEQSNAHKTVAARYASLEGNIRRQLSLLRPDRVNSGKYLQWVSTSYDDVWAASPLIADDIYKEWVVFAKKNNLFIPIEYEMMVEGVTEENIRDLCDVGEIRINVAEETTRGRAMTAPEPITLHSISEEPKKSTPASHVRRTSDTFKFTTHGKETLKRTKTKRTVEYSAFPDLNRYGDSQMEYELGRMFRND